MLEVAVDMNVEVRRPARAGAEAIPGDKPVALRPRDLRLRRLDRIQRAEPGGALEGPRGDAIVRFKSRGTSEVGAKLACEVVPEIEMCSLLGSVLRRRT